jgi:hypothetical protein
MKAEPDVTPRRRQAADILRRARKLPRGPYRNDLRLLAAGLLRLDGMHLATRQSPSQKFVDFPNLPHQR